MRASFAADAGVATDSFFTEESLGDGEEEGADALLELLASTYCYPCGDGHNEERLDMWHLLLARGAQCHIEDTCAHMRALAEVLDARTFADCADKRQFLAQPPLHRSALHDAADDASGVLRGFAQSWRRYNDFNSGDAQRAAFGAFYTSQLRLQAAYGTVDAARRRAEVRLPASVLAPFRMKVPAGVEATCPITICELEEGEDAFRLECGHWIDADAGEKYFHSNSACPLCRRPVPEGAEDDAA